MTYSCHTEDLETIVNSCITRFETHSERECEHIGEQQRETDCRENEDNDPIFVPSKRQHRHRDFRSNASNDC